jgi:hypothetical protein
MGGRDDRLIAGPRISHRGHGSQPIHPPGGAVAQVGSRSCRRAEVFIPGDTDSMCVVCQRWRSTAEGRIVGEVMRQEIQKCAEPAPAKDLGKERTTGKDPYVVLPSPFFWGPWTSAEGGTFQFLVSLPRRFPTSTRRPSACGAPTRSSVSTRDTSAGPASLGSFQRVLPVLPRLRLAGRVWRRSTGLWVTRSRSGFLGEIQ